MTPAERQLIEELFDRLATLEDAPRDAEAERAIRDGMRQAPNAVYALVQTALVQDEALRRANGRIEELQAALGPGPANEPQHRGGFLDNMRDAFFGRRDEPRGSVPSVRPGDAPMGAPPGYGGGAPMGAPPGYGAGGPPPGYGAPMQQQPGRGGSFLGTAAAAAAGVIGGSLLLDSIRGMMGGGGRQGQAMADSFGGGHGATPWGGGGGGNNDLARQAGIDDIGRSSGSGSGPFGQNQGLFDGNNADGDDLFNNSGFDDADSGGFDSGGFDGGGGGGD
jgi:hypothetical protein